MQGYFYWNAVQKWNVWHNPLQPTLQHFYLDVIKSTKQCNKENPHHAKEQQNNIHLKAIIVFIICIV